MRIYIDSELWLLKDWFAEKENITQKTATIERKTEKAMLLNFNNIDDSNKWIPKSVITKYDPATMVDTLDKWS